MPTSPLDRATLLVFGAHPDDIEFGCGGVVVKETLAGRPAHLVVCSLGESGTRGKPEQRKAEAEQAAILLGATIEFTNLGGDAHFECRVEHTLTLAGILRRMKPDTVLAPSVVENQHPDHSKLGRMVRDAARLARDGGVEELRGLEPHVIKHLLFYAVTPEAEPGDLAKVIIDVSNPEVLAAWTVAMGAHASQVLSQNYIEMQLTRARLQGMRCGVGHAIALFPSDPLVFGSLDALDGAARIF